MSRFISIVLLCLVIPSACADDPPQNTSLRDELLLRTKSDQAARVAIVEFMKANNIRSLSSEKKAEYDKLMLAVTQADSENTKWLKKIIEKNGWPTISHVGKDGSQAAWLLVQHADAHPQFQRHCLDLMSKLPSNEISQRNVAYLTDRVLLAEGKKQRYGTQFQKLNDTWQPFPLEDEAGVDKRRAEMGLSTLAEYASQLKKQYDTPKSKPPSR